MHPGPHLPGPQPPGQNPPGPQLPDLQLPDLRGRRILVVGSSGAGKTTLARALAATLSVPHHEMDALALIGPGWRENPRLVEEVDEASAGPAWVFDSLGRPAVRDLLWTRADTIVWLDHPRRVVMSRVLRRSAARTLLRRKVFGGNVETLRQWFDPEHPAWWAWSQYAPRQAEITRRCADPQFAPLEVVRLGSPRTAREWLAGVSARSRSHSPAGNSDAVDVTPEYRLPRELT